MTQEMKHSTGADRPCAGGSGAITVAFSDGARVARWLAPLFSGGVGVAVVSGCTVRGLLTDQLAFASEYVEGRLQTIFLNGKPVDDIDSARVGAGDVLALSAAMPGLVGATMRRGGRYAVLRQAISHTARNEGPCPTEPICLTIKLFNLIAAELAPVLLKRGVWIDGDRLADHLRLFGDGCRQGLAGLQLDGAPAPEDPAGLAAVLRGIRLFLTLTSGGISGAAGR